MATEVKIAKSTCVSCHKILPRTEMQQVSQKVYSGSSIGASTNLFANSKGKRNTRVSGRDYYRNRKVWMCNSCAKENKTSDGSRLYTFLGWALLIFVFINLPKFLQEYL